jgi:hypothetical protein
MGIGCVCPVKCGMKNIFYAFYNNSSGFTKKQGSITSNSDKNNARYLIYNLKSYSGAW